MSKCCDDFVVDVVLEGPQGPKGDPGDVTPEFLAVRDEAVTAAEQAAAIAAQVAIALDLFTPPSLDFSRPAMAGAAQIVLLGA